MSSTHFFLIQAGKSSKYIIICKKNIFFEMHAFRQYNRIQTFKWFILLFGIMLNYIYYHIKKSPFLVMQT